jgi:hypothetical protein
MSKFIFWLIASLSFVAFVALSALAHLLLKDAGVDFTGRLLVTMPISFVSGWIGGKLFLILWDEKVATRA